MGRNASGERGGAAGPPQRPPVLPFALRGSLDSPAHKNIPQSCTPSPAQRGVPGEQGQTLVAVSPGMGCLVSQCDSGWRELAPASERVEATFPAPPALPVAELGTRDSISGSSGLMATRQVPAHAQDSVTTRSRRSPMPWGPQAGHRPPRSPPVPLGSAAPSSRHCACFSLSLFVFTPSKAWHFGRKDSHFVSLERGFQRKRSCVFSLGKMAFQKRGGCRPQLPEKGQAARGPGWPPVRGRVSVWGFVSSEPYIFQLHRTHWLCFLERLLSIWCQALFSLVFGLNKADVWPVDCVLEEASSEQEGLDPVGHPASLLPSGPVCPTARLGGQPPRHLVCIPLSSLESNIIF